MSSNQKKIEDIVIALLKTQAPFTVAATAPVLNYDANGDTVDSRNRVVVKASEPVALVPSRTPTVANKVFQSEVEIMIKLVTQTSATMDTWEAAVDAALATSPTAIQALASASFANGFLLDVNNGGNRQGEGAENRERTKTLTAVFIP